MPNLIKSPEKPEILAPAGSLEAFFAAMEKGADAVYAGLKAFSARAKAKNFSLEQLERMLAYAHAHGRRVYVTLNTLIKEAELPLLVETLSALEAMRVDGVIIQDLAIWRLIRDHFPAIPLHASTQMTIHNRAGAKQLEEMGFKRAVLARELQLDDIAEIAASTSVEIECFIHGALCFSISGQCYFSSFLGGYSGNRGRCAQPCRRLYRQRGKEGYYFSPNDLSAIDILPQLAQAGVKSLKIEGRMKPAEYVANVVSAYRMVLDAPERKRADAVTEAKELLKASFGRVPTKGFLVSSNPTDIATPTLKGATGRFLGNIKSTSGGRIVFEVRDRLHIGDRIRVQPKSDMAGKAFTVKELFVGREQVKSAREKSTVATIAPFPCSLGDAVFKVSSETAFTMSENACQRRLESLKPEPLPCDLTISWREGTMDIAATCGDIQFQREYELGALEPARTGDMEGVLRAQFERSGDIPFRLANFSAPDFPPLLVPLPRLKDIRRDFFRALADEVRGKRKARTAEAKGRALEALRLPSAAKTPARSETAVKVDNLRDWPLLHQEGVDALIVPVSRANLHQLPTVARKFRGREEQLIWHIPFIIWNHELDAYREAIRFIMNAGFRRFELSNLSHFQFFKGMDAELLTDFRLYSLNTQALQAWQDVGATSATLYIEDDGENMERLLSVDLPIRRRVILYASVPVITSRIRIRELKGDSQLVSDRGDIYDVAARDGLTVVTAKRPFSISHFRGRLAQAGCSSFVADLAQVPAEHRKRLIDAISRGEQIRDTSEFNFSMGLV
ncbi:MAG: DUF3656 domain-containing protein [Geobacter sp.]|nr:DUF3656 domain-containing protein [Geobacter sp.]